MATTDSAIQDEVHDLTKVDSAISGLSSSPPVTKHRRSSSTTSGVYNIDELAKQKTEIAVAPETQKLGWKINTSSSTIEEKEYLKKLLVNPPVKKIDLKFPLGLQVTARNLKGVTIKDAIDAIHKPYKHKADDEIELPYLKGFEWDKDESWTSLIIHLQSTPGVSNQTTSKKNKKKGKEDAEE